MLKFKPGDMVKIKNYNSPDYRVGVVLKQTYTGSDFAFDKFDVLFEGNVKNCTRQELVLVKNKQAFVKK